MRSPIAVLSLFASIAAAPGAAAQSLVIVNARIVDGKGAVGFLKRVKEYIEEPEEMLLES